MKPSYVTVRFFELNDKTRLAPKEYFFLNYEELKVNDLVVVDTRFGLALAVVTDFPAIKPDDLSEKRMKEVVAKVDTTAFDRRQAQAERAEALKKQMDQHIRGMEEVNRYKVYAENDPALKALLDEYLNLTQ